MMTELQVDSLAELERVLQSCSVSMCGIRVVVDTLPGDAICTATVRKGVLWLVMDCDKASAPGHALAMLREAKVHLCLDQLPPAIPRPRGCGERFPLAKAS